jgi:thiol-disulfide isomerase/thioredoxin
LADTAALIVWLITMPITDAESESIVNACQDRRRWLVAAVLAAATLAGIGLAWRTRQAPTTTSSVEAALWQMKFVQPDGSPLAMASLRGRPLLMNFWASWCGPCVEEFPLLSRFYKKNSAKDWQVLGLAVDQLEPVKRFLKLNPVTFPVVLAGLPGIETSRALGNLNGALPFTVVLGSDGRVADRKLGRVTPDELRAWALLG